MYYIAISFHMQQDIRSFFRHFTEKTLLRRKLPPYISFVIITQKQNLTSAFLQLKWLFDNQGALGFKVAAPLHGGNQLHLASRLCLDRQLVI